MLESVAWASHRSEEAAEGNEAEFVQVIVPVYNEGENVRVLYENLVLEGVPFNELKFVYDFDGDTTLPVIRELEARDRRIVADKNEFGRGVVNALRWGFSRARRGPVIVIMGDNSDKLSIVPEMIERWRNGSVVVSPSRYMKGGEQHGGGVIKSTLSRLAGTSLRLLGFPTSDPTNNFKLYDGDWLRSQTLESRGGFEIALELTYKAFRDRRRIDQLPTVWRDRTMGESNFRLSKWLPHYLRWYCRCLGELSRRAL
jgi:hypothetical protein